MTTPDSQTASPNTFADLSRSLADLIEQHADRVVGVQGARRISGTVIGPEHVLSVAHVLTGDQLDVVMQGGRTLRGQVVGRDPASDLALISVPGLSGTAAQSGTSPRVGELQLALARPGAELQASLGLQGQRSAERGWLATGAAPFPGVSGGVLLDAQGRMLGVLNAGVRRGVLLAVPTERALRVAGLLGTVGRVPQGYLGVATQPVRFPSLEQPSLEEGGAASARAGRRGPGRGRLGLTVVHVDPQSPAEAAGLKVGDVLLRLGEDALRHPGQLHGDIRSRPGETVTLGVLRGGEQLQLSVTLGER